MFVIAASITSGLLLEHRFFQIVFALQLGFYVLAATGWILARAKIRIGFLSMPFYFCLLQAGGMLGLALTLCGRRIGAWKPVE